VSGATTDTGATQSRLWLLTPARGLAQPLLHWKDFQLQLGLFGSGTLTVTLHKDQITASYSGDGALATDFGHHGTQGLWSIDYYHRGTRVFSGPVQTVIYNRDGHEGNAWVTVVAEMWLPALLRRRIVETSTRAPFTVTNDTWHDIACKLVREQCDPDDIVTPTNWQKNAETRDDFGAFIVEVGADTGSGTEDYRLETRCNLWDAVTELCNMPSADADKLWPTITESPAGTFTVDFVTGRSGGSRAIGSDLTSSIVFATPRRNLPRFELTHDGGATENHLVSGGAGPGTGQSVRYAANDTSITTRNLGVFEGVYDVPGGRDNATLDNELAMQLYRTADQSTWTAAIVETADQQWPGDFGLMDSVTVYDEYYSETVADMIIGVRLSYPAPGPYTIELMFGQPPRNDARNMARSGGGAGGGRGGGGSGRSKDGQRYVYDHVDGDKGSSTAHEAQTGLDVVGDGGSDIRAYVTVTDDTTDGNDDEVEVGIVGDFTSGDVTATGWTTIKDAGGGTIWILATDADPSP